MLSLAEALAALPDTADGIAAHLLARGIRGARQNAECCPIANYLTGEGFTRVYVIETEASAEEQWLCVDLPASVTEFIDRIDDGEWPELVSEPEDDIETQETTA